MRRWTVNRYLGTILLMALAGVNANAVPSELPALVVPDCLGVNIHFTGTEAEQVAKIADGGFKFIRMDYSWVHIEKQKGVYDFKPYDLLVESLASRGIRALFILDYGNPLYDNDMSPHTDEGRAAFVKFAAAGAQRYKGKGVLWEIWNEPNIFFWRPQPNVEDYVKLAKAVYPALKKVDPNCTVLAPALSGWDVAFLESAFGLGLLDAADAISLHPYGSSKPEDASVLYAKTRELVAKYGKGKTYPIVSGEWGYSSFNKGVSIETQADYVARQFLSNMMNNIPLSIWYDWRDDGPDPNENEHRFGTVAQDMADKPAYIAVKTLTSHLNGYAYANRMAVDSPDDYLLLFRKGQSTRLAAWTTAEPHSIKLPFDVEKVQVVSRSGQSSEAEIKDGLLDLKLTSSPQYIVPMGDSRRWGIDAAWNVDADARLTDDGLVLDVNSMFDGIDIGKAHVDVSGAGVTPASLDPASGKTETKYIHSGQDNPVVIVTLQLDGVKEPLVRRVVVSSSVCPRVNVMPSTDKEILFDIHRPSVGAKPVFSGKLVLANTEGVTLLDTSVPFTIPADKDRVTIRARTKEQPTQFTTACNLLDSKGHVIVRMPAGRYKIIETFADGKPGESVLKVGVALDGDPEVKGSAKLTYAAAGAIAPVKICGKLDYSFEKGWKFLRVFADANPPIEDRPTRFGIWVKGNGSTEMVRARITDAGDETFQPDLGPVNFTDWRCIYGDLSGTIAGHWGGKNTGRIKYPLRWDTLFLLDNRSGAKTGGTIYIGPAMLYYE